MWYVPVPAINPYKELSPGITQWLQKSASGQEQRYGLGWGLGLIFCTRQIEDTGIKRTKILFLKKAVKY